MTNCPKHVEAILDELGISPDIFAARPLVLHPEATALVIADTGDNKREYLLMQPAADAWHAMKAAASAEEINLRIFSAFRSIQHQTEIIRSKLKKGQSLDQILRVNAPPGYSEHHSGRAIDVTTDGVHSLELEFEGTKAFRWLSVNANRFGFSLSFPRNNRYGYMYEPWHWCFIPGMNVQLIPPDPAYQASYSDYIAELGDEVRYPFPLDFEYRDFPALLNKLANSSQGIGLAEGFVPHTTYWLVQNGELIGVSNLRHYLNERLREHGGHIGLGIRPRFRGKGYGKELLRLTMEKAKEMGIQEIHIHCHKDNEASARMIRSNGGILDSEITEKSSNKVLQKYRVQS